jgi:diguanylate cyclase (GGDEF)-like protein
MYPSIFFVLFISVCVIYMSIGILVLQYNYKAPVNNIFFIMILAINIWSLGLAFGIIAPDIESCLFWRRFASFGWGTAYAIILHFILIITGNDASIKKWWSRALLYLPAAICILAFGIPSGLNSNPYNLHLTQFGWVNIAENNFWDYFFYAYYIGYIAFGLTLLLRWGKKSSEHNVRIQAHSIFWSFLITLTIASFTDVFNIYTPQIAPIILLIPIVIIYHNIVKYGFISSNLASQKKSFLPIVVVVIFYVFLSYLQIRLTASGNVSPLGLLEVNTLLGLITQIQMFLSIYLIIKEGKAGLITSILINSATLLSSLVSIIQSRSLKPLPGTISHLVTFLIIGLIARYKRETSENIKEINNQRNILEISEKKLYQMAYYDSLTELYNKDMFVEQLNKSISAAKRSASLLGVVFLDLDSFKSINDTMGHPTGDHVLKMVAARLSSCLRDEDTVARFGGDEFLILITNIKSYDELKHVTDRIMSIFKNSMSVQDIQYYITASAGVAVYPVDGENSETLIKNADIAMYQAKACGKNQCIYCSPALKEEAITKMKLTNSLYRALDRNELYLNYQPQIEAETQEIIGFEALLRWNNKEYGLVSPSIFIPLAEQTDLIRQIGLWAIERACEDFKSFKKCYDKDLYLSINLSIEQLKDNNVTEKISKVLSATETNAKDIQIEITESIAFNDDPDILQRLIEIRNLGISISIDDFGKGYSSFNRLMTFPIDLLKIDMEFVRGITSSSKKDKAIIKSIIQLAKNLNIAVLAEGVETKEQYIYLKDNGCDIIQGYYFYKPMPANEIENLLR